MSEPFFSVIIPTLNEEQHLPSLLRCLKKQKLTDFEVIVVDGKSEDDTVAKARESRKEFKRKKINLRVLNSPRRNVSFQRNLGAKYAKGKYLVFFDADVVIGNDFLAKVYQHIDKEESLLMTTWLKPDSDDLVDELLTLLANYGIEIVRHTKKIFIPGFNIIVERNIFWTVGGFNEEVKISEDHLFVYKAKKMGINMRFLKDPVLVASLRRFRSEGRIEVIRKYIKAFTHSTFKGPITEELFDYPMGGRYHSMHKKKSIWQRFLQKLR